MVSENLHKGCKMNWRGAIAQLLIGVAIFCVPHQASATDDDIGVWTVFTATDAFHSQSGPSRWHYWIDAQARYFDLGSGVNQYLVRPAIGYRLDDSVQVWAGYARFRTSNQSGTVADENRTWQQINWSLGRWLDGTFTMRARLLQRHLSTGNDTGLVLRFLTKYTRPFGDDGKKSLIIGVEPIFDLKDTDWSGSDGIAQNRTYLGVGWHIREKLTIETGYMNQFVWRNSSENTSNHLGVINFKVKF